MQIPILNGIYTDKVGDFRTSYPRNMTPVPKSNGISEGYIRPSEGIITIGEGTGVDRGGINWDGVCYRVMGSSLVEVGSDNTIKVVGDVSSNNLTVSMDYSFDRLAIVSNGRLFYYDKKDVTEVISKNLGFGLLSVVFVDGYFLVTDGSVIFTTELNDPTQINPLKYGSAEVDPDSIKQLVKVRNEPFAVGRYSIEVFDNVGGSLFPFQRVAGGYIPRGSISSRGACFFMEAVAIVGGGRNEPVAVWVCLNGQSTKISTREIDQILQRYTDDQLEACIVEARTDKSHRFLLIHLEDQTLVYDGEASTASSTPVWFTLDSGLGDISKYRARGLVWAYNKWIVGDPTTYKIGYLTDTISTHYGDPVTWEFGTMILYNEGRGAVIHELELVTLSGRVQFGEDPVVWTSYSLDGLTWSQEKAKRCGGFGDRGIRLSWLQQGAFRNFRVQKFRGDSSAFISIARLEAKIEPSYV